MSRSPTCWPVAQPDARPARFKIPVQLKITAQLKFTTVPFIILGIMITATSGHGQTLAELAKQYPKHILPLVTKYCGNCHSADETKGDLDLERFTTASDVRNDTRTWEKVLKRLHDEEMPPEKAPQPSPAERGQLLQWVKNYLLADARQRAGDPGLVLLRRLTKAEYNYTIRDLTGIDLKPAQQFLEDSVAGEGFANTGEALFMAADLIPMYLASARQVVDHAVLTPSGIRFSANSNPAHWINEAAQRIKDFYYHYTNRNGRVPLAHYLEATLRYRDRDPSDQRSLEEIAAQLTRENEKQLSPKYLHLLWKVFNDPHPTGEMAEVIRQWRTSKSVFASRTIPKASNSIDHGTQGLYDAATHIETAHSSDPGDPATFLHGIIPGAFDDPGPYGLQNEAGDTVDTGFIWTSDSHIVVDFGSPKRVQNIHFWSGYGGGARGANMEVSYASSPQGPYTIPRGGSFNYTTSLGGGILEDGSKSPDSTGFYQYEFEPATARYWRVATTNPTAGHMPRTTTLHFGSIPNLVAPQLTAIITGRQLRLWTINKQTNHLLGSIGLFGDHLTPLRNEAGERIVDSDAYASFANWFPRTVCFAPVIPVNTDLTVELFLREDEALSRLLLDDSQCEQLDRLWDDLLYLSRAPVKELHNTKEFIDFQPADRIENTNKFADLIPSLEVKAAAFEQSARAAEPRQLEAIVELADRAWRRPLSPAEQNELRQLYERFRNEQAMSHDVAIRSVLTRILVSPHFLYRVERPSADEETAEVTVWELASRLSYFLWSSLPDEALFTAAAQEKLPQQDVLNSETRRMLLDSKAEALAIEFAGQWLQFRGFDQYDGKSETRFPKFTPTLRAAMNQEATAFIKDIICHDRSVLEFLRADHTYLNEELASHYNIPDVEGAEFRRVERVSQFGRGGVASMGSILSKQSGALRTSPVLRGTWVVDTLLGREIPNPPDDVPQLAEDEVNTDGFTMRQRVERHRADASCAVCHEKIDPYGFALEAYDPIGRLRNQDLNGNPIDARSTLTSGETMEGLSGLQNYLLQHQDEFIRQFCRKLLGYALGRAVELSDDPLLEEMGNQLKKQEYRFSAAVLAIVNSSQFRRHRGQNHPREISR